MSQKKAEKASNGQVSSNPEYKPANQSRKRNLTAEYKARVLAEIEELPHGQIGAYLRQEGLYSTQIVHWRKQQEAGKLKGSRPTAEEGDLRRRVAELERENDQLRGKLAQAELVIAVQKKLARTLESISPNDGER